MPLTVELPNILQKQARTLPATIRPSTTWLHYHPENHRLLKSPIPLIVEQDSETDDFIVSDNYVKAYGLGESLQEAIEDYGAMLLDIYENLNDNMNNLSPSLQQQHKILIGDWGLEIGDWGLEIGDWFLTTGDWGLGIEDW